MSNVAGTPEVTGLDTIEDVDYVDGEIQFQFAKPAEDPPADGEDPAPAEGADPAPAEGGEDPPKSDDHDYKKRYEDLYPEFTRKSQELSDLKDRLAALEKDAKGEETPEIDPAAELEALFEGLDPRELLEDPAGFKDLFTKAVGHSTEAQLRKTLDPILQELVPLLEDHRAMLEVRDLVTKYPDSREMTAEIGEVLKLDDTGTMTVEQAYKVAMLARKRAGAAPEPKKADEEPAVPTPPKDAPAPTQEPNPAASPRSPRPALPADTGVAGVVEEPQRKVDSIRAAFEKSLEDLAAGG